MRPGRKKLLWIAPLAILGMVVFAFLGGEVVRLLWNWVLPSLFGWRELSFWQALGILALCRILFGGFGMHGRPGSRRRSGWDERCANMTPEEREKFREAMRARWRFGPQSPQTSHDS